MKGLPCVVLSCRVRRTLSSGPAAIGRYTKNARSDQTAGGSGPEQVASRGSAQRADARARMILAGTPGRRLGGSHGHHPCGAELIYMVMNFRIAASASTPTTTTAIMAGSTARPSHSQPQALAGPRNSLAT